MAEGGLFTVRVPAELVEVQQLEPVPVTVLQYPVKVPVVEPAVQEKVAAVPLHPVKEQEPEGGVTLIQSIPAWP